MSVRVLLAGLLVAAGAVVSWWLMTGRLEACHARRANAQVAIDRLTAANEDLRAELERQNAGIAATMEAARAASERAQAAAETVRRASVATRGQIDALTARLAAPDGLDCLTAAAEVRAGLR